ncbi:kinesin light chain [Penicillium herquei]|nr:kinesin light chain [Penicillium herquei]
MWHFLNAISGILFLGTPFRGSGAAQVARWAAHLSHSSGKLSSFKLIRILDKESEKLGEVRSDFLTTAKEFQIPISYYCELVETRLLNKIFPSFVVPWTPRLWSAFYTTMLLVDPASATLDDSNCIKLGVRHVCLNKFEKEGCREYGQVRTEILKHQNGIPSLMERREKASRQLIYLPKPSNPRFVGRDTFLKLLIDSICAKIHSIRDRRTAIWGLEGIGKTEVALKVAHELAEARDATGKPVWSVFWISASTEESWNKDYRALARYLHMNMDYDTSGNIDLRKRVNERLGMRPTEWLLVVDDARDWLEPEDLPHGRNGSTLVTTGDRRVAQKISDDRELGRLSEEEAVTLLEQAFPSNAQDKSLTDKGPARELVKVRLQLHPLAIKLASEYIARQGILIQEYIHTWDRISGGESTDNWPITHIVNEVFAISLDRVISEDKDVFAVLGKIAFLDQKNIPISLLDGMNNEKGSPISLQRVLDVLVSYSFITRCRDLDSTSKRTNSIDIQETCTESIDVHELVQHAIKDRFRKEGTHDQRVTLEVVSLAERLKLPTLNTKDEWSMKMGHVKFVLQHAEKVYQSADRNLNLPIIFEYGKPGWYLYYVVGQMHLLLGDQEEAEHYQQKALQLEQRDLTNKFLQRLIPTKHAKPIDAKESDPNATLMKSDDEHLEDYLSRLSKALSQASTRITNGSYFEAESLLVRIFQAAREELGRTHPLSITALSRLSQAQNLQSNFKEAAMTLERVLALQRELLRKGHQGSHRIYRAIFISLEALAYTYQSQGDFVSAQERLEQAIKILEDHFHDPHTVLSCKEHLRLVLEQQGRRKEAEELN